MKNKVRSIVFSSSPDLLPVYDEFITRGVVKKPVMTSNYNVTVGKSWEYFWKAIEDNNSENSRFKDSDDLKVSLRKIHDILYEYANSGAFSELFLRDKEEYLSSLNFTFLYGKYSFSYLYKSIGSPNQEKITKSGSSIRITNRSRTIEDDLLKSRRALNANLLHTQDALLADYLFLRLKCFAVHDSFGCSIYDVHLLMDYSNSYFEERLVGGISKEYSPFILF